MSAAEESAVPAMQAGAEAVHAFAQPVQGDGTPASAAALMRRIAAYAHGQNTKHAIAKAARAAGIAFSRAFNLFHGRARRIDAQEWLALQAAALRLSRQRAALLRAELAEIERQLETEECAPVCAWQPMPPSGSLTSHSPHRIGASASFGG